MAIIGNFKAGTDGYVGTIHTLSLSRKVHIKANDRKQSENAPDFRIFTGRTELGAAWIRRKSDDDSQEYLSITLDDPSFPKPVHAALFEKQDGIAYLVWDRDRQEA